MQELKTKKRYGRLQKAMGDYCLLAGSPLDAQDHYSTGADGCMISTQFSRRCAGPPTCLLVQGSADAAI